MGHHSLQIGILAIACGLLSGVTTAHAVPETWVSRTGTDTDTCLLAAPCQTFQFAHGQTDPGGSINVLTPGNFGPLTITKAISIVADGVEAVINTAANGAAIIVQASASNDIVSLRGLTIDVSDNTGISFVSGFALHVQNCFIRRTANGIIFAPSAAGSSKLHVADSVIAHSRGTGIVVRPSGNSGARATLDRVRAERNGNGISFEGISTTGLINGTVSNSVAAGNLETGIFAGDNGSGSVTVMVDHSVITNGVSGIRTSGPGVTIRIGDSTVSGNNTGLVAQGTSEIVSYGTNKVRGNTTNGAPTSTIAMQ
jgi:hypothetical protein